MEPVKDFSGLQEMVKSRVESPRRVMVVGNCYSRWMRALRKAADLELVKPILVGNEARINETAELHNIDISDFEIVTAKSVAVAPAVDALQSDSVDILVRGDYGILDMLTALFRKDAGFRLKRKMISGISAHFVGSLGRMLFVTDPIVIPEPDLKAKIAMLENAVGYTKKLGFRKPNVALTAAVEVIYPVMKHTVEAAVISKMNDRNQIKGCLVDGPLSMDCAVIESAAKDKGVTGWVAGRADILVQPTIETSYGMYRAFAVYVNAPTGSIVVGGKVPVVITSRADSVDTNFNSLLMALA